MGLLLPDESRLDPQQIRRMNVNERRVRGIACPFGAEGLTVVVNKVCVVPRGTSRSSGAALGWQVFDPFALLGGLP